MRTTTYILPLLLALLLAGCAHEEYVGPQASAPITFSSIPDNQTRATKTGLETYVKDFLVYGINGNVQSGAWKTENKVMDNYVVWWNENTAATTTTNSTDWEYAGGYTGNEGLTGDEALKRSSLSADEKTRISTKQFVKYWDYGQPYHIFWGLAKASDAGTFTASTTTDAGTIVTHTIHGITAPTDNNPSTCLYYTAPVVVNKSNYQKPVEMPFVCLGSRIRIGFYEVIPGYAVKDVTFYDSDGNPLAGEAAKNCTAKGKFVSSGSLTFTYDLDVAGGFTKPTATIVLNDDPNTVVSQQLGTLNYTFPDDNKLTGETDADRQYVAKVSTAPTYAGRVEWPGYYTYILPFPQNDKPLTLKCDYTLFSTDGSGQEIKVTGATASVPSEYCKWQSNHSYTYLFKFTDDKLKPITFVAFSEIPNTTDNNQGTITTVGDYSITTYQEGSTDDEGIQYKVNRDMVVSVIRNMSEEKTNIQPITLNGSTDYVVIYHQKTTKEWVVETDVTNDTEPSAGVYKEKLEYAGTTNGYDANGNAHFIPDITGTYRVEYWHKEGDGEPQMLAVKIVKIRGEEVTVEEYDKWQSGTSKEENW